MEAGSGPGDEEATVQAPRARARAGVTAAPPARPTEVRPTGASPREAMAEEEIARTRAFARMVLAVAGLTAVGVFAAGGDPTAKALVLVALAVMAGAVSALLWVIATRRERYSATLVTTAAATGFLAVLAAIYYWGWLSPVAAVALFGLYFFALGASTTGVVVLWLVAAGGHATLAGLTMAGVLADRGVVPTASIGVRDQVISLLVIQVLYAAAVGFGRRSRRVTLDAVERLDRAGRAVAAREALLAEARLELDRRQRVGGPGRFTEQTLGPYRLGHLLGRGGMGEVYEASELATGQPVAIKVLHPTSLGDEVALGRFLREAAVTTRLRSPHIAQVLEVGVTAGEVPYIAMERLRGDDLAQVLRRVRRMPVVEVVTLIRQIATALAAAHGDGVIHRDLKPSNLFRARVGDVEVWKVIDFGVAKSSDGASLTAGQVVGTPSFMAPEQATGDELDHRADLFALAIIAYRALTGRPPFTGRDAPGIMFDVVYRMPPQPSALVAVHADVDCVLALGLAKDRRRRFADAPAFADALAAALEGRLPTDLRRLGRALVAEHPWGAQVATPPPPRPS